MDLKEIRQLIKVVENSNIGELEIEEDGKKVRITKSVSSNTGMIYTPDVPMFHSPAPQNPPVLQHTVMSGSASQGETVVQAAEAVNTNTYEVRSPMVGTFYGAPSPDAEPYVSVGKQISVGQVLCIVEAMKLMNEIESEVSGKLVKILIENAQPVEYNQVLFIIEKS
ncbi:MAG: acetyl-CoA carboxylase biotin carboxyl carrier protein [Calditrichaceae bacterium]